MNNTNNNNNNNNNNNSNNTNNNNNNNNKNENKQKDNHDNVSYKPRGKYTPKNRNVLLGMKRCVYLQHEEKDDPVTLALLRNGIPVGLIKSLKPILDPFIYLLKLQELKGANAVLVVRKFLRSVGQYERSHIEIHSGLARCSCIKCLTITDPFTLLMTLFGSLCYSVLYMASLSPKPVAMHKELISHFTQRKSETLSDLIFVQYIPGISKLRFSDYIGSFGITFETHPISLNFGGIYIDEPISTQHVISNSVCNSSCPCSGSVYRHFECAKHIGSKKCGECKPILHYGKCILKHCKIINEIAEHNQVELPENKEVEKQSNAYLNLDLLEAASDEEEDPEAESLLGMSINVIELYIATKDKSLMEALEFESVTPSNKQKKTVITGSWYDRIDESYEVELADVQKTAGFIRKGESLSARSRSSMRSRSRRKPMPHVLKMASDYDLVTNCNLQKVGSSSEKQFTMEFPEVTGIPASYIYATMLKDYNVKDSMSAMKVQDYAIGVLSGCVTYICDLYKDYASGKLDIHSEQMVLDKQIMNFMTFRDVLSYFHSLKNYLINISDTHDLDMKKVRKIYSIKPPKILSYLKGRYVYFDLKEYEHIITEDVTVESSISRIHRRGVKYAIWTNFSDTASFVAKKFAPLPKIHHVTQSTNKKQMIIDIMKRHNLYESFEESGLSWKRFKDCCKSEVFPYSEFVRRLSNKQSVRHQLLVLGSQM